MIPPDVESFEAISRDLIRDWCDAMVGVQFNKPSDPSAHGALFCHACGVIHGRCMDAVYPFFHVAKATGNEQFLTAGKAVFEWAENISLENGAWTNGLSPDSWQGTTLFGAIAVAETLHHHGELLDESTYDRWTERLSRAGDYIYNNIIHLDFANVNYGCVAIYGMHLLGGILSRPMYSERSRQLVGELNAYISEPSGLLMGEGKPATGRSPRGCRPVDISYNVEESLPAMALAARATGDLRLKSTVIRLLENHLEFMLPDGAWDNSFGTRHAKWTYWGGRTSDGCQLGYALMAEYNPAFATAVIENTRLMRRCTHDGLLAGGPHLAHTGLKPCVHHTFTHAKAFAAVLDEKGLAGRIHHGAPLPRERADGIRSYPEMATWLAARGPWRVTVTAGDWTYREDVRQPTGGCISMLWHSGAGPIFTGSMPRYVRVEPHNMQVNPYPGDYPLTPRVELRQGDEWFTQLYDLTAEVQHHDANGVLQFEVTTRLTDESGQAPSHCRTDVNLSYVFEKEAATINVSAPGVGNDTNRPCLVLPVISPSGEEVIQRASDRIEIRKPGANVIITANVALHIQDCGRSRIFNLVPGFEAVVIVAEIPAIEPLSCRLDVVSSR